MIVVRRLVWDPGNVAHIGRHKVLPEEAEDVCHADHVVLQSHRWRLVLIGPTREGRILAVVIELEEAPDVYYVVTARPANRKERRYYQRQRGGTSS